MNTAYFEMCQLHLLAQRGELGFGVLENRVERHVFEPDRMRVIRGRCRKLHREELHNWYSCQILLG
jgi:hypothetical protein